MIAGVVVAKNKELAEQIYFNQNGIGAVLSPESSNLIRRGIQTLAVRMDRHLSNTEKIVEFLQSRQEIKRIYFPGLPETKDYEIASKEVEGFGGLVSFELQDGLDAIKFVESLTLIQLAVSLGAVESLIELPYKMTHAELSRKEQEEIGITPQLVRLAVGIESPNDLIADIQQGLDLLHYQS